MEFPTLAQSNVVLSPALSVDTSYIYIYIAIGLIVKKEVLRLLRWNPMVKHQIGAYNSIQKFMATIQSFI